MNWIRFKIKSAVVRKLIKGTGMVVLLMVKMGQAITSCSRYLYLVQTNLRKREDTIPNSTPEVPGKITETSAMILLIAFKWSLWINCIVISQCLLIILIVTWKQMWGTCQTTTITTLTPLTSLSICPWWQANTMTNTLMQTSFYRCSISAHQILKIEIVPVLPWCQIIK